MTVNTNNSRNQYNADGVSTAFVFTGRILDASHIKVLSTTLGVTTTITTGFTVSGVGGASATVTFAVAPTAPSVITLLRNVPLTQTVDYTDNDPFPAETHEGALDKLTMIAQQLNDKVTRAAVLPDAAASNLVVQLPLAPVDTASIVWDGVTGAMKNGPLTSDILNAAANAATITSLAGQVVTNAAAAAASATLAQAAVGGVKISNTDTTASQLANKLAFNAGTFTVTVSNPSGNAQMNVAGNFATQSDVQTGTNGALIVTPASLGGLKGRFLRRIVVPYSGYLYTMSSDANSIQVHCRGGGGAGAGSVATGSTAYAAGGGGGQGGLNEVLYTRTQLANMASAYGYGGYNMYCYLGAGGSSYTPTAVCQASGAGSSTYFGEVYANGGQGGNSYINTTAGVPTSGAPGGSYNGGSSYGTVLRQAYGAAGQNGINAYIGGAGGGQGGGCNPLPTAATSAGGLTTYGTNGQGDGGGGSGSSNYISQAAKQGGNGANGEMWIDEYA